MAFTPIGDTLEQSKDKGKLGQQVEAAEVVVFAEEVFKDMFKDESKHVRPLFLKNRTLTVTCASSVVAQEIRLNQAQIVAKINKKLGKNEVDRIRYLS